MYTETTLNLTPQRIQELVTIVGGGGDVKSGADEYIGKQLFYTPNVAEITAKPMHVASLDGACHFHAKARTVFLLM